MKIVKVFTTFLAIGVLLTACNQNQQPTQVANANTNAANANTMLAEDMPYDESDPFIKDNFDLQRVGELVERSKSPAELEAYLNDDDGINNLDLNGDGYADYISVAEFDDRGDGQRGLSLFSRFGPDLIQEIATIFFYRDEPRYPGARIYVRGDDRLYGDNYYYETNWLDRSLGIASLLFGDHDRYVSPYYYDRYPDDYVPYQVVDTPVYRSRIERLYPNPLFVYSTAPVYYDRIKIKSPNNGLHLGWIYGRAMKPTKEWIEFRKKNPHKPAFVKKEKDGKPGRSGDAPGPERGDAPGKDKPGKDDRNVDTGRDKPGKPPQEMKSVGPQKADGPGKGKGGDKGPGGPGKGKGKGKP